MTGVITYIRRCIKTRYLLAIMCMFGLMLTTLNRLLVALMMRNVVYSDRFELKNPACPPTFPTTQFRNRSSHIDEFLWGSQLQSFIMAGFAFGNFLGWLPSGLATDYFGGKSLCGYSVFIPGVLSLITPLCMRTSPYIFMANRILNGIFSSAQGPSTAFIAARWFPHKKVGLMLAIVLLGVPLGFILKFLFLRHASYIFNKWVSEYYFNGILSMIWAYIWQAYIWDDPFECPYIGGQELHLLAKTVPVYTNNSELYPGSTWPWKSIFTSTSLWALAMGTMGYFWAFYFVISIVPTLYFAEVHMCDFAEYQYVATFLFFLMGLAMLTAGAVSDKLKRERIFNTTHITKMYFTVSSISSSMCVLGITHSDCYLTTVFLYYICAIALLGIGFTAHMQACLSIAPNFIGVVLSFTGLFGAMCFPVEVQLVTRLTPNSTVKEWRTVSYFISVITIFTTGIFLKWGNCQPQPWNQLFQMKGKLVANKTSFSSDITKRLEEKNSSNDKKDFESATQQSVLSCDLQTNNNVDNTTKPIVSMDPLVNMKTSSKSMFQNPLAENRDNQSCSQIEIGTDGTKSVQHMSKIDTSDNVIHKQISQVKTKMPRTKRFHFKRKARILNTESKLNNVEME